MAKYEDPAFGPVARLSAFGSPCLTNPYIKKSVEATKVLIYAAGPMSNLQ